MYKNECIPYYTININYYFIFIYKKKQVEQKVTNKYISILKNVM
jgi:hypothetical protein